jgi:hypothetical protein
MSLESSVSDATIWSVTLELSLKILEESFNDHNNMLIVHAIFWVSDIIVLLVASYLLQNER